MQQSGEPLQSVDIRDRVFPRLGFVVDGAIADALNRPFVAQPGGDFAIAHLESPSGIDLLFVRRNRDYAQAFDPGSAEPIALLTSLRVRQIVLMTQRLLVNQNEPQVSAAEALTVAVIHEPACTRLLSAAFDRVEANKDVDGVFLREEFDEFDLSLSTELTAARQAGHCVVAIEATTLRSDLTSTASEKALASILREIPDAVSPLGSCYCRSETADLKSQVDASDSGPK